jgi:hypothetical protein
MNNDELLEYMKSTVDITKWNFFSAVELIKLSSRAVLNALYKQGRIKIRDGVHGKIVEYIPDRV